MANICAPPKNPFIKVKQLCAQLCGWLFAVRVHKWVGMAWREPASKPACHTWNCFANRGRMCDAQYWKSSSISFRLFYLFVSLSVSLSLALLRLFMNELQITWYFFFNSLFSKVIFFMCEVIFCAHDNAVLVNTQWLVDLISNSPAHKKLMQFKQLFLNKRQSARRRRAKTKGKYESKAYLHLSHVYFANFLDSWYQMCCVGHTSGMSGTHIHSNIRDRKEKVAAARWIIVVIISSVSTISYLLVINHK